MTHDSNEEQIRQAEADVAYCLVVLTANLMRVTRGAGHPYWIYKQANELLKSMQVHRELNNNTGLSSQFYNDALDFKTEWGEASEIERIYECVANGSLQFVASKMLGQIPQTALGQREMMEGFDNWARRGSLGQSNGL